MFIESSNTHILFITRCQGVGYAGANTQTKLNALVWMPRVSAILSMMVCMAVDMLFYF
jgi:hypothetical protein